MGVTFHLIESNLKKRFTESIPETDRAGVITESIMAVARDTHTSTAEIGMLEVPQ